MNRPNAAAIAAAIPVATLVVAAALWLAVSGQVADAQTAGTTSGAELYATQCVSCHGTDARGVPDRGPSLRDEGRAAVDFVLRTGRMPLADTDEQAGGDPAATPRNRSWPSSTMSARSEPVPTFLWSMPRPATVLRVARSTG